MKFATFTTDGVETPGVVHEDCVFPIGTADSVLDLVRAGLPAALEAGRAAIAAGAGVPLAGVTLRAPIPQPPTVRDFVAFEEHVDGVVRAVQGTAGVPDAWYEAPRFYFTNPYAIHGPGDFVQTPSGCTELDFELEVAAVVGLEGADLDPETAEGHIFGYTILNDWSARDLQRREMQMNLGPAKGKDFATTLGPWIVTPDELDSYRDPEGFLRLECSVAVNGEQVGHDVLSNMGWTFGAMVAYASRETWVRPGDVLGSGTVGNGGCLAELWGRRGEQTPPPLREGDTVTLTVQGLGSVTNTVIASVATPDVPPARRLDHAAERTRAVSIP